VYPREADRAGRRLFAAHLRQRSLRLVPQVHADVHRDAGIDLGELVAHAGGLGGCPPRRAQGFDRSFAFASLRRPPAALDRRPSLPAASAALAAPDPACARPCRVTRTRELVNRDSLFRSPGGARLEVRAMDLRGTSNFCWLTGAAGSLPR